MTEQEFSDLERRRLSASVAKEEIELKKLELEVKQLTSRIDKPFYKSPEFLRLLVAGLSLSLILAAYAQYIFLPTQTRLTQKAETAEFIIQQNAARHDAQVARLELIQQQIQDEADNSSVQLAVARKKLNEAQSQNDKLLERLNILTASSEDDGDLKKLQSDVQASSTEIERQLSQVTESTLVIEGLSEAAATEQRLGVGRSGWIYVGYFPNDQWQHKTIDISNGMPEVGRQYKVTENVNLRVDAPKFTLFGYKLGDSSGYLLPGQHVTVRQVEEVGLSKVWAHVKIVSPDA